MDYAPSQIRTCQMNKVLTPVIAQTCLHEVVLCAKYVRMFLHYCLLEQQSTELRNTRTNFGPVQLRSVSMNDP